MNNLLEVENLTVHYGNSEIPAISNFNFTVTKGETLCLHGHSGCGKSTIVWSIMGKIHEKCGTPKGNIFFQDKNLLTCTKEEWKDIRWKKLSLVSQSAMSSFNPVYTMKQTIFEMLTVYCPHINKIEKTNIATELMELVHLPARTLHAYPHELSGGMKQRAAIAIAIMLSPEIMILDEATTGLDVIVEADILKMLIDLKRLKGMSILFISHDTRIASAFCDRQVNIT